MLEVAIEKRLGDFRLDAAFTAGGRLTALFGRSGSGKTSVVNALAGLSRPDAGRIALDGRVLFDSVAGVHVPARRRRVGYVFQDARLFPHLTVRGNLAYGMKLVPPAERRLDFDAVVDLLGLGALLGRHPRTLSGGEAQRVAIGRALLASPRLLLMDEPLASLDAPRKQEILPLIERLRDQVEMPIVYVSHSLDEVIRLADTMVLLSDGAVVASGGVEELMSRLDLRPLTGRYEAGAVIGATVAEPDAGYGLTRLAFHGHSLHVPRLDLPAGTGLRVRIRARDVALSLQAPTGISILNVFPGTVAAIEAAEDGPQVDVLVDVGTPLVARITRRSLTELGLAVGRPVHALVKAVAIDRHNLGWRGTARR
ncbi:MAG: molybdenum ABC transporter ATP-binding protein [Hyphomicrobiales bacterium]|nr:molybdenum ABC transporter ATP-binding protein [Hyphomicrobiales bacterium]